MPAKIKKVAFSFKKDDVLLASCMAHLENNAYLKEDVNVYDADGSLVDVARVANRTLVFKFLDYGMEPTEKAIQLAEKVKKYCKSPVVKMLSGKTITSFDEAMLKISDAETIEDNYLLSVAVCLPSSFLKNMDFRDVEERIRLTDKEPINHVNNRVDSITFEPVKMKWMDKWDSFLVTAITTDNKLVSFWTRNTNDWKIGKLVECSCRFKSMYKGASTINYIKKLGN